MIDAEYALVVSDGFFRDALLLVRIAGDVTNILDFKLDCGAAPTSDGCNDPLWDGSRPLL